MALLSSTTAGDYLCIGDSIALYSVETEGYAYSLQSRWVQYSTPVYIFLLKEIHRFSIFFSKLIKCHVQKYTTDLLCFNFYALNDSK